MRGIVEVRSDPVLGRERHASYVHFRARLVEVTWGADSPQQGYPVSVRIEAWDRVGLWRDISGAVADAGINIKEVQQGVVLVHHAPPVI